MPEPDKPDADPLTGRLEYRYEVEAQIIFSVIADSEEEAAKLARTILQGSHLVPGDEIYVGEGAIDGRVYVDGEAALALVDYYSPDAEGENESQEGGAT